MSPKPASVSEQLGLLLPDVARRGGGSVQVHLPSGAPIELVYNFLEENVPACELPDPLRLPGGEQVADAETWLKRQRPHLLEAFRREIFGRTPHTHFEMQFEQLAKSNQAQGGQAIRKEIRVSFKTGRGEREMEILIYLPLSASEKPVPVFLGLNFLGNHTVHPDPEIRLSTKWIPETMGSGAENNLATPVARGIRASRWQVEKILSAGFGLATIYCGDLAPDTPHGYRDGVMVLFDEDRQQPAADEWDAISTWAWGLQRAMDYFEQDDEIDVRRVVVMGHSRLGKAALWAAAQDERFAAAISNNSGCMGAALTCRQFGETATSIQAAFPYWFCGNFKAYVERQGYRQLDQHMLLALIAPRPVYVASAQMDLWADPRGEFLSARAAEQVYRLFGLRGLGVEKQPALHAPVFGDIGYHLRAGEHDVTGYDWEQFIRFANRLSSG